MWHTATVLSVVNVTTSLAFICTGLLLRRQPGQQRVAWALMLAGAFRSLDFANSFINGGPWPLYALVCGGLDRLAGAYAILRYPRPALLRYQRWYLVILAGWMLIGRSLIAVTSIPRWNGNPAASWWPALLPRLGLMTAISDVVNAGEGVLGIALVVLLILRLARTTGLDRIVITPVIVSGLAAVVAASVTAVAQLMANLDSVGPNTAYTAEGLVDLAVPLAFLVAAIQSGLLLRNIAGLAAQVSAGADVDGVRYALRAALRDPTLEVVELSAAGAAAAQVPGDVGAAGGRRSGRDAAARPAGGADQGRGRRADRRHHRRPRPGPVPGAVQRGRADQRAGAAERPAPGPRGPRRAEPGPRVPGPAAGGRAGRAPAARAGPARRGPAAPAGPRRPAHRGDDADQRPGRDGGVRAGPAPARRGAGRAAQPGPRHPPRGADPGRPGRRAGGCRRAAAAAGPGHAPRPCGSAPAVEATAYFVACEALANVVKHAGARSAEVSVRADGSWLSLEISDDGAGGAGAGGAGVGLANMRDRVGAVDGEVTIDSPPGAGTRVLVRLPCG